MPDYVVRPASAEDTHRIVDLLKICLGEGSVPRTAEFWDWKHRRSPFGESPVLLAEANGELIGVRAFMRWRWTDGEGVVESVRAVDTATHPEHRGKGIFTRLTSCLLESLRGDCVDFVFNTPNAQSRPGYRKMGWNVYGRVPVAVAVQRPLHVARYAWHRVRSDARQITVPAPGGSGGLESVRGFLRSADSAELLSEPRRKGELHGLSTPAGRSFLEWRYATVPGLEYDAVWATRCGASAAVIVRRCRRGTLSELRVCHVLLGSAPTSSVLASELIRSAAGATGADVVTAVRPGDARMRRALALSGLIPAPHMGPVLTVRPIQGTSRRGGRQRDPFGHGFDFSAGDIELF